MCDTTLSVDSLLDLFNNSYSATHKRQIGWSSVPVYCREGVLKTQIFGMRSVYLTHCSIALFSLFRYGDNTDLVQTGVY